MNVDFRCEHCGKLLSAPAHANEPVRCQHCLKLTAVPAGLASLPRPKVSGVEAGAPLPPVAGGAGGAPPQQGEGEAGEPQEGEFIGVMERAMPFVISLFFHLGLVLVTVFLGTLFIEKKEAPPGEIVTPETFDPRGEDDTPPGGGTLTPTERQSMTNSGGGARVARVTESSVRSSIIASGGGDGEARKGLGMIGIGGATGGDSDQGSGVGTGHGWFGAGGGGGGFFGLGGKGGRGGKTAAHIVYVIDRSGSMMENFDAVKQEMFTSIGQLSDKQDFDVIMFSSGEPKELVDKRLVPATSEYKTKAVEWLRQIFASSDTDPVPAVKRAFDVLNKINDKKGKVIFLLTDSDFPDNDAVVKAFRALNAKKDVIVFTFLYGDPTDDAVKTMETVAKENNGKYKRVRPED